MRKSLLVVLSVAAVATALHAGELHDLFKQAKVAGKVKVAKVDHKPGHDDQPKFHGITEIGIERSVCFGPCPAYTVIFKSDGTVRYHGHDFVARKGDWTGSIDTWRLAEVVAVLVDLQVDKLDDEYSIPVTDVAAVFTTLVKDGQRKVIKNYANAGPARLWAVEQLIDGLMPAVEWNAQENPAPSTRPAK